MYVDMIVWVEVWLDPSGQKAVRIQAKNYINGLWGNEAAEIRVHGHFLRQTPTNPAEFPDADIVGVASEFPGALLETDPRTREACQEAAIKYVYNELVRQEEEKDDRR